MTQIQRMNERLLAQLLRNALIIRRLRLIGGGNFLRFPHSALSHRHTLPLLLTSLFFLFSSCEKAIDASMRDEGHPVLYGYYQEATGLYQESVDVDSVVRFRTKVDAYTTVHPDSKDTWYYPEIEKCIRQRLVTIDVVIRVGNGGDWSDTLHYDF